ncbi:MAG: PadR family transcriptional regulator [Alphaproteobacteria bacterium]|nr:PadR family transcriptional regulator [Alphaproteobacteria bacterium]
MKESTGQRLGHHGGRSGHRGGRGGSHDGSHEHTFGDEPHDPSHSGGRHGRHGRHRVIDSSELRLLLMKLLAETPRHGYDLIREIEAITGGAYAPSPGMVYPTLTLLQEMDLIAELDSDGPRKAFVLTAQGETEVSAKAKDIDQIMMRLSSLKENHERVDAGPVRRAVDNLRRVIRSRLGGEDVDKEMLHTVAGILDETAQRIERL